MRTVGPRVGLTEARTRGARRMTVASTFVSVVVAVFVFGTIAAGCSSDGSDGAEAAGGAGATTAGTATTTTTTEGAATATYLSIGDSYAQGYQPPTDDVTADYTDGFAYLLPELAKAKGYDLELVNFGCGGATVGSIVGTAGCADPASSPGGPSYDDEPQLDAAIAYLEEHPGEVELITVSIGGNDVTKCARGAEDPIQCVADAVGTIDENLGPILSRLRDAAGPDVTIVGLTYPDVILGAYLQESTRSLGELSVVAFREFINPMLERNYEAVDGIFVDVTAGTDAYVPLEEMTELEPYGEIPVAVAEVCELTWFCERNDIHPRSEGYQAIAELIVEALPER